MDIENVFPEEIKGIRAGVGWNEDSTKRLYFLDYEVVIDGVTQRRTTKAEEMANSAPDIPGAMSNLAATVAADTGLTLPTP